MTARFAEEQHLRAAVLAGNEAAWRVLYDRCFASVYAYVLLRTGRHVQRTEEVTQEAWLIAVRKIRKFDPSRAPFGAWMRGIADGVLRNHARKWGRRDHTEMPLDADTVAHGLDGTARRVALAEHIALAMERLPSDYQDMLSEKYGEGRTVKEMAERRNSSQKAVESMLGRARAAFREAYRAVDRPQPEELRR